VSVTCIRAKITAFYTEGQNFNLSLKQSIVFTIETTFDPWLNLVAQKTIWYKNQKIMYKFSAQGQNKSVQNLIMAMRVSNTKI
jgi:hypothetical protein